MTPPAVRDQRDATPRRPGGRGASRRIGRRGFLGFLLALGLGGLPGLRVRRTRLRSGWILREDER